MFCVSPNWLRRDQDCKLAIMTGNLTLDRGSCCASRSRHSCQSGLMQDWRLSSRLSSITTGSQEAGSGGAASPTQLRTQPSSYPTRKQCCPAANCRSVIGGRNNMPTSRRCSDQPQRRRRKRASRLSYRSCSKAALAMTYHCTAQLAVIARHVTMKQNFRLQKRHAVFSLVFTNSSISWLRITKLVDNPRPCFGQTRYQAT